MKTYTAKINNLKRNWYLIDATDTPMGRVATKAAIILRGKHKRDYTPNYDMGDFVVIVNSKKVLLTGKKLEQKEYHRHTRYPGGIRTETLKNLLKTRPNEPLKRAIIGMIPNNSFRTSQVKRIKIYSDENYKHTQKLIKIEI